MPTYKAPLREYRFLLKDVLDIERYSNLPSFSDAPIDLIDQVLEEGAKFCEGVLHIVALAWNEMVASANMAFGMYPGLSHGAYEAIHHHGDDAQKQTYLPKLVTGEWTGTMNLTE